MWIRKFRLELSGEDVNIVFKDLRMDFRYNEYFAVGNLDNMADTFDIDIYNLGTETYKSLTSAKQVTIKFFAGYGDADELDLAFEGVVSNVVGRRKIPEHITTIYCIPRGLAKASKPVGYKGTREDKLVDVIEGLASELGLSTLYEAVDDVIEIPYRAKTIEGNGIAEIAEIGRQFYFMPRVEGDELKIIATPDKGVIERITKVHVLKAELVRGTPKASVAKMSVPYAFNTTIRTGDVIDTSILDGKENNPETKGIGDPTGIIDVSGLGKGSLHYADSLSKFAVATKYQIVSATHAGSNYTEQFISNYECVVHTDNTKGGV